MNRWRTSISKVINLVLLTEPVWVSAASSLVYLSVISGWGTFIPWLFLILAFAPFLLSLIRYGRLNRRTPFDIPILLLFGGMIVGFVVSEHFDISLGAFQTFLAGVAFYYSVVNYPKPSWLVVPGLSLALIGAVVALVFAAKWMSEDVIIPHGLELALVIIGAVAIGITVFSRQILPRIAGGLIVVMIMGVTILFADESLHRLLSLESIEGRLWLWSKVITPVEGSSVWAGLGLGCWPLVHIQEYAYMGHVHSAYLELYVNTGVVGLVALIAFMIVGFKLAADILYSPGNSLYYGFGAGAILASLAVMALGFLESAPLGFGFIYRESYHYIFSPIPFILAGVLVLARQLLREGLAG